MATLDFRVLGPVAVREEGSELALPGGKPRSLLAFLLLRANQVVPVEDVVDALWGDEAPQSARHAVEVHVSRLRSTLGQSMSERLLTRFGGYSLRVEPGELDLWR